MVHDPSALEPRCRLQDEDGEGYGALISEGNIADAIRERTEVHLRKLGVTVSSKVSRQRAITHAQPSARAQLFAPSPASQPIVMRAEFAFAPNLTLIDTPGLLLKARRRWQPAGRVVRCPVR